MHNGSYTTANYYGSYANNWDGLVVHLYNAFEVILDEYYSLINLLSQIHLKCMAKL